MLGRTERPPLKEDWSDGAQHPLLWSTPICDPNEVMQVET
jgi:hypothetical protein